MDLEAIIEEALELKPQERYIVIENLVESLNTRDREIDAIWRKESKKRLQAYKEGKVQTLTYEQVFHG